MKACAIVCGAAMETQSAVVHRHRRDTVKHKAHMGMGSSAGRDPLLGVLQMRDNVRMARERCCRPAGLGEYSRWGAVSVLARRQASWLPVWRWRRGPTSTMRWPPRRAPSPSKTMAASAGGGGGQPVAACDDVGHFSLLLLRPTRWAIAVRAFHRRRWPMRSLGHRHPAAVGTLSGHVAARDGAVCNAAREGPRGEPAFGPAR